ncbi:MAG TPA: NADH-quinone oxidoreductase subunit K [Planctomycetota bacterium]|nr:NADH-quinone oxidoreductase subunit K [Planctomycetota bacterium]
MTGSPLPFLLLTALFLAGVCCAVVRTNVVRMVLGLGIAGTAASLLLAVLGRGGAEAGAAGANPAASASASAADAAAGAAATGGAVAPALAAAVIVVGLATLILAAALCVRLYDRHRTADISEIRRLRG